jgi:hypothetical protein
LNIRVRLQKPVSEEPPCKLFPSRVWIAHCILDFTLFLKLQAKLSILHYQENLKLHI